MILIDPFYTFRTEYKNMNLIEKDENISIDLEILSTELYTSGKDQVLDEIANMILYAGNLIEELYTELENNQADCILCRGSYPEEN